MSPDQLNDAELIERVRKVVEGQQFEYLKEYARREMNKCYTQFEVAQDIGEVRKLQGKISMFRWLLQNCNMVTNL